MAERLKSASPTTFVGSAAKVIVWLPLAMAKPIVAGSLVPLAFCAVTETLFVTAFVGVPEIKPVAELRFRPPGKVPEVMTKFVGAPDAVILFEKATNTWPVKLVAVTTGAAPADSTVPDTGTLTFVAPALERTTLPDFEPARAEALIRTETVPLADPPLCVIVAVSPNVAPSVATSKSAGAVTVMSVVRLAPVAPKVCAADAVPAVALKGVSAPVVLMVGPVCAALTVPVTTKSSPVWKWFKYQVPVPEAPPVVTRKVTVVVAGRFWRAEILERVIAVWGLPPEPDVTDPQVIALPIFTKLVPSRL